VEEMLQRAWDHGVSGIVAVAASDDPGIFAETTRLAESSPRIWAAAGIHPHYASHFDVLWPQLVETMGHDRLVAIGEFGLDFHYTFSPREQQMDAMKRQLELGQELNMPIVLHIREAFEEALSVLDSFCRKHDGVVHCFTGSTSQAAEFLSRGFHLSIPGVVTFGRRVSALVEAVESIPLDRLLAETDSPYLAPMPFRGKRNEPAYVAFIVETLAAIKGTDPAEMAAATRENTKRVFRLQ